MDQEPDPTSIDAAWWRTALAWIGAFAGTLALVLISVIVIDP
jgi:hypothetical protein